MIVIHDFNYLKPHFVGIGWVVTTTGLNADDINTLVKQREFPMPTVNGQRQGEPVWDRAEVLAWQETRGMMKMLRRREFVG